MPAKITPATTLVRVQELNDAGNSFRKIAEMLAAEGVPAGRASEPLASCQRPLVLG